MLWALRFQLSSSQATSSHMVSQGRTSTLRVQAAESVQQYRRRLRRRHLNAQRRNASAHGPSRARVPVFECGTV